MTAWAESSAARTAGLAASRISWPKGLMYHSRSIRAGRSSSWVLEKAMYCLRRVGREPGRFASSMRSWCSTSSRVEAGVAREASRAEECEGWEIEFWPVMVVPLARPTEMWCVKLVLMAGRTEVWLGTEQMLERR